MKKRPDPEGAAPPDATETRAEIRIRALGLLARREHSVLELKRKLVQRGYTPALILSVLQELSSQGMLSEVRYAEAWVSSCIARGQGPVKLRAKLRQQGLTDLQVQQALATADTDWGQLASEVRHKRFGTALPGSLAERSRQTRFLESRGFTAEHIRHALGPDTGD